MRLIKAVSVTIPCMMGLYMRVCNPVSLAIDGPNLRQLVKRKFSRCGNYSRFTDSYGLIQTIATSSGVIDTGV